MSKHQGSNREGEGGVVHIYTNAAWTSKETRLAGAAFLGNERILSWYKNDHALSP